MYKTMLSFTIKKQKKQNKQQQQQTNKQTNKQTGHMFPLVVLCILWTRLGLDKIPITNYLLTSTMDGRQ